jgi:reactive intermediate/imine deaminase
MPKQPITSPNLPKPGGAYSPGLRAGDFVFVAGQVGRNPQTGEIGATVEEQTAQTIENIRIILEAAGATLADVVKATVHLADMDLFDRYNAVYATYFPDPKPVRTTVGSHLHDVLVEIDVIAYTGD